MTVRVLLADDDAEIAEAIAEALASEPELSVVGVARDAPEAVALARATRPDVAVLDVRMPGGGGEAAAREISALPSPPHLVAHSASGDSAAVERLLAAGAVGYVVKGSTRAELVASVKRAARGQGTLSPSVTTGVIGSLAGRLVRDRRTEQLAHEATDRIRQVLVGGGPATAYQPIVRLSDMRVSGYEALSRFEGPPDRPPPAWFEEAWAAGLGPDLELACVARAIERFSAAPAGVAVNLSPETISDQRLIALASGCHDLTVEITEHAAVEDYDRFNDGLARLRAQGARLAVDDAGAGYASLQHILRLAPEMIKLDMTLTRGLNEDPARRALVAALVVFAGETHAELVAEGIETRGELDALRNLGVDYGQGYHLGRPGPLPPNNGAARDASGAAW